MPSALWVPRAAKAAPMLGGQQSGSQKRPGFLECVFARVAESRRRPHYEVSHREALQGWSGLRRLPGRKRGLHHFRGIAGSDVEERLFGLREKCHSAPWERSWMAENNPQSPCGEDS
eukprot:Skav202452  [mRNA]  locus=scaffold149:94544:96964:+ [translate_table: standard]